MWGLGECWVWKYTFEHQHHIDVFKAVRVAELIQKAVWIEKTCGALIQVELAKETEKRPIK